MDGLDQVLMLEMAVENYQEAMFLDMGPYDILLGIDDSE